jgi:hypothetical protein
LKLILIISFVLTVFVTYVSQNIIGAGEYVAEGLPLLLGYLYLITVLPGVRYNSTSIVIIIYILILTIITILDILNRDDEIFRLVFVYCYLPALWLATYNEKIAKDAQSLLKMVAFVATISAIVGVSQYFGIQEIIPVDLNRARGLSRSTLNYSSLMMIAYIAADNAQLKSKNIIKLTIFTGAVCSLGRGGVIGIIIYEIIKNINDKLRILILAMAIITTYLVLLILYQFTNILPQELSLMVNKFLYSLDFVNDPGNSERIVSYARFFDEWRIAGYGFGTTGPGSQRLTNYSTGFESFILALIYHGGIFCVTFVPLLLMMFYKNNMLIDKKYLIATAFAYAGMMLAQQTFETPSVNILAWIVLLAVANSNIREKK